MTTVVVVVVVVVVGVVDVLVVTVDALYKKNIVNYFFVCCFLRPNRLSIQYDQI